MLAQDAERLRRATARACDHVRLERRRRGHVVTDGRAGLADVVVLVARRQPPAERRTSGKRGGECQAQQASTDEGTRGHVGMNEAREGFLMDVVSVAVIIVAVALAMLTYWLLERATVAGVVVFGVALLVFALVYTAGPAVLSL